MKNKILVDLIKDKNIVIPLYLYKLRNKLDLNMDEFMLMMYLYNEGELILFDLNKIGDELGINQKNLMILIGSLNGKNLVDFKVIANDKNIREEYISLENFYNKVSLLLMNDDNKEKESIDTKSLFSTIEEEFGRPLTPMEYERVKDWLEKNMSIEIIECALREAVLGGITTFKYIDSILYEWNKKGIKTKEDVEKHLSNRRKKKEEDTKKIDIVDLEWLDEDDS